MFLIAEVLQILSKSELSHTKYQVTTTSISRFSKKSLPVSNLAECILRRKSAPKILKYPRSSSPLSPESIPSENNEIKSSPTGNKFRGKG